MITIESIESTFGKEIPVDKRGLVVQAVDYINRRNTKISTDLLYDINGTCDVYRDFYKRIKIAVHKGAVLIETNQPAQGLPKLGPIKRHERASYRVE